MAKLIVSILTSLDGYCAGPGGALDQLPMGPAFDLHNLALMRKADTFVFGAVTYPLFRSYWPRVDRGPGADPVASEISQRFESGKKLVVSDNITGMGTGPWADTETVSRAHAAQRIAELKRQAGPDMLIFGSARLCSALMSQGLIDELHLLVAGVTLGSGVPTFHPESQVSLRLDTPGRLANSDIAALHYMTRA